MESAADFSGQLLPAALCLTHRLSCGCCANVVVVVALLYEGGKAESRSRGSACNSFSGTALPPVHCESCKMIEKKRNMIHQWQASPNPDGAS